MQHNFAFLSYVAVDMLSKLLVMDPEQRLSAEQALAHPYLATFSDPDDEVIQLKVQLCAGQICQIILSMVKSTAVHQYFTNDQLSI